MNRSVRGPTLAEFCSLGVGKLVESCISLSESSCLFRYVRETPRLRHAFSHSLHEFTQKA